MSDETQDAEERVTLGALFEVAMKEMRLEQRAALRARRARIRELEQAEESEAPGSRKRRRGRSSWTCALFDERYAEALALASGNTSDVAVAGHFRGLSRQGYRGIEPETLAVIHGHVVDI